MAKDITEKVDFNIIRYANCWEDADILLEGLALKTGSKILSIGSAGDNSFALLSTDPQMVVAVDINKIQLYLIELKKAAIKQLDREGVLAFLGFAPSDNRFGIYQQINAELTSDAKAYWDSNEAIVNGGVIYAGKFENYFKLFAKRILPWIHSQATVRKLLSTKNGEEQQAFYHKTWNSWRWKLLFKIFFSKYVMGKYGRDPEFLRQVGVPVSQTIYDKAAAHLQSVAAQQNHILRFTLTGNFGELLPYYLKSENFETIKLNIDKLVIKEGFAQQAIDEYGKFNSMNLSNIFEYMDKQTFTNVATDLVNGLEMNGKLAYWNLMVPRMISQVLPDVVRYEKELSATLTQQDKGFFYDQFIVDSIE